MKIRYANSPQEIEISGDPVELLQLAEILASGGGELETEHGDSGPYDQTLVGVIVKQTAEQNVSFNVESALRLAISGSTDKLNALAKNIEGLARDGTRDEHWHAEYFPGHSFLDDNSIPVVFSRR